MKLIKILALLTALFSMSSTIVKANTLEMKGDTIPVFIRVLQPGGISVVDIKCHCLTHPLYPFAMTPALLLLFLKASIF